MNQQGIASDFPVMASFCAAFFTLTMTIFFNLYRTWAEKMKPRYGLSSPSQKRSPDTKDWDRNKQEILDLSDHKSKSNKLLQNLRQKTTKTKKPHGHQKKHISSQQEEKAEHLDMDHHFVRFPDYVWSIFFIGIPAGLLWLKGIIKLKIRIILYDLGLISKKDHDPREIVGRLCLEGTMVIHYYSKDHENNIAGFYYPNFPVVKSDGTVHIHGKSIMLFSYSGCLMTQ